MSSPFDLSSKVSLVTGAGSGLGRTFCEAMAENGSHVVCADVNEVSAKQTADLVKKTGIRTLAIKADVSSHQDVRAMFEQVKRKFGRLDILFNNAGISSKSLRLHEMPLSDWNRVINVDLTGVFLCMQEGVKLMLGQRKGSVINISSVLGMVGRAAKANYCAAKAGVIALTECAAADYGPDGIRVNAIAPGFFSGTKLGESAGLNAGETQKLWAAMAGRTALRRVGEPSEIKGLAVYLASDASSFVSGATFIIDGGLVSTI